MMVHLASARNHTASFFYSPSARSMAPGCIMSDPPGMPEYRSVYGGDGGGPRSVPSLRPGIMRLDLLHNNQSQ
jgi:hypothetical protein